MNPALYDQYLQLLESGRRNEARKALRNFLDSFNGWEERSTWVKAFLNERDHDRKIRHEIYGEAVFPILKAGYEANDPWSLFQLGLTCQNLYSAVALWSQIGGVTGYGFFLRCHRIDPEFPGVRSHLLNELVRSLRYCIHEWPAGILHGTDGANLDQLDEIGEDIAFARTLDRDGEWTELFDEVWEKVALYKVQLEALRKPAVDL